MAAKAAGTGFAAVLSGRTTAETFAGHPARARCWEERGRLWTDCKACFTLCQSSLRVPSPL